jgi:hypothetical protein
MPEGSQAFRSDRIQATGHEGHQAPSWSDATKFPLTPLQSTPVFTRRFDDVPRSERIQGVIETPAQDVSWRGAFPAPPLSRHVDRHDVLGGLTDGYYPVAT